MALSDAFGRCTELSLLGVQRTTLMRVNGANDAVDGAHSAASECHRVVALKRTTMRGAVHGRS